MKTSTSLLGPGCLTLALIALVPGHVLAGDSHGHKHHHQSAHVHGEALLQVALDDKTVDLIFHSPAANLVGFEHEPRNQRQKQRLAETREWLESTPLVSTKNDDCTVTTSVIHLSQQSDRDHGDTHSEMEVSQQLQCESRPQNQLVTPLSGQFPEIRRLRVDWVADHGQGQIVLDQGDARIELRP